MLLSKELRDSKSNVCWKIDFVSYQVKYESYSEILLIYLKSSNWLKYWFRNELKRLFQAHVEIRAVMRHKRSICMGDLVLKMNLKI